jgi:hypothetical protein
MYLGRGLRPLPEPMSRDALTVLASVLGSGATAAVVAARAQRKSQFRERMLTVASDFAATTMKVLAALRRVKPTKPGVRRHRNAVLLSDLELRASRYADLQQSFDELRGLRGRVRLHFPGIGRERSAVTIRADDVIGSLRMASDAAEKFWQRCDDQPAKRRQFEDRFDREYQQARSLAWEQLNDFCNRAAESSNRHERGPSRRAQLAYRLGRSFRRPPEAVGSGADHAPRTSPSSA